MSTPSYGGDPGAEERRSAPAVRAPGPQPPPAATARAAVQRALARKRLAASAPAAAAPTRLKRAQWSKSWACQKDEVQLSVRVTGTPPARVRFVIFEERPSGPDQEIATLTEEGKGQRTVSHTWTIALPGGKRSGTPLARLRFVATDGTTSADSGSPVAKLEVVPPQVHPVFYTPDRPGSSTKVPLHAFKVYLVCHEGTAIGRFRELRAWEGRLAQGPQHRPVSLDAGSQIRLYVTHHNRLGREQRSRRFAADGSGYPLLGPIEVPEKDGARIDVDIWSQNDWLVVQGRLEDGLVDGRTPHVVSLGPHPSSYEIGKTLRCSDGVRYFPEGDTTKKDQQDYGMSPGPKLLTAFGRPGGYPLWAGTLTPIAAATLKAHLIIRRRGNRTMIAGTFGDLRKSSENLVLPYHHTYDRALVQRLAAVPVSGRYGSQVNALPNPPAEARLGGDVCWHSQGQHNSCGPHSFAAAMNYWYPYTNHPDYKNGAWYADDRINNINDGATCPADLAGAATKFNVNGSDHDAESISRSQSLKLLKLWIHAGVPVVVLVEEHYGVLSLHWKLCVGYDRQRFFFVNSGADHESVASRRTAGVNYRRAPIGNDVDSIEQFYGKWSAAGGDLVDAFSSIDERTFLPIYPREARFAGDRVR